MESAAAMLARVLDFWPELSAVLHVVLGVWASAHAVLRKRDPRAAIGWVGVIWLAPLAGAFLYLLFGINRIQRRAKMLRADPWSPEVSWRLAPHSAERRAPVLAPPGAHLEPLVRLASAVTRRALLRGNHVTPLMNGDQAYPAMLDAIGRAERSVTLSTFIFAHDRVGRRFVAALREAAARGVEVRVLIDGVGADYTLPRVLRPLHRAGIRAACFLPTLIPWAFRYSNLRNHRKILVVDGRVGFTGGMNIRRTHELQDRPRRAVRDLHFRLEGPVVSHLQEVFAEDWEFSTNERLEGDVWFPEIQEIGSVLARGVSDGPDEDLDKLALILHGALACARSRVYIVTPYFLPDPVLISSLNTAALRGVEVHLVLPERTNVRLVQWASRAVLPQVMEHGCRVWLTPPPFDHSKLMLVDTAWVLLGSANWDPRSLRLNFEFNVECYDRALASRLEGWVRGKIGKARPLELDELLRRPLPARLRDGVSRLASPYL